jgi:hypothetical protein
MAMRHDGFMTIIGALPINRQSLDRASTPATRHNPGI